MSLKALRAVTLKAYLIFTGFDVESHLLTHKQLETHGCVLSTVATDALVLKHQAISAHIAD